MEQQRQKAHTALRCLPDEARNHWWTQDEVAQCLNAVETKTPGPLDLTRSALDYVLRLPTTRDDPSIRWNKVRLGRGGGTVHYYYFHDLDDLEKKPGPSSMQSEHERWAARQKQGRPDPASVGRSSVSMHAWEG